MARGVLILSLWGVLIGCVVIGSLLPAASPVMVAIGRLHVSDTLLSLCAYVALSGLPVLGSPGWWKGIAAGLSMFLLGLLLEAGQHFAPGRAVELGDVVANGAGVSCSALLGLPVRTLIALL
jgi:VanZ family protein